MTAKIRVDEIGPGTFSTEKSVAFSVAGVRYNLVVDRSDVDERERLLNVSVIDQSQADVLIELPRETFTSGSRLRVPRAMIAT